MKMLKLAFGIAAVLVTVSVALATSAFKAPQPGSPRVEQWFEYQSGPVDQPSSYTLSGSSSPGCGGTDQVCAIKAMDNGNEQPELTEELISEINAALANPQSSHPNVELRD